MQLYCMLCKSMVWGGVMGEIKDGWVVWGFLHEICYLVTELLCRTCFISFTGKNEKKDREGRWT